MLTEQDHLRRQASASVGISCSMIFTLSGISVQYEAADTGKIGGYASCSFFSYGIVVLDGLYADSATSQSHHDNPTVTKSTHPFLTDTSG